MENYQGFLSVDADLTSCVSELKVPASLPQRFRGRIAKFFKKTECPRRVHTKPMALQSRVYTTKTIYKSRRQSGLGLRSWVASTLRELMMCPMSFRPFSVQKVRGREAARDSEFSTLLGWPAPQARGRRQSIQRLRDGEEERKWGGRAWGRVFHRLHIGSPFGYTGI